MTIQQWITSAVMQLKNTGITSAKLDAEVLLSHSLNCDRTYLHAHPETTIFADFLPVLTAQLRLRTDRVPLAYILGYKEFYGRKFRVTPATLVPRPESEAIVETVLELENTSSQPKRLIDVGTGSGILGITSKLEAPHIAVTLSDISKAALHVASHNAMQLHAKVTIAPAAHLLTAQTVPYDYIIANLPYVDSNWNDTSPEIRHEPQLALYAREHGLALIYELLLQAVALLQPGGYLLLEADPSQHSAIIAQAHKLSLLPHCQHGYCLALTNT